MSRDELLERVAVHPDVCSGMPVIRNTRLPIAAILDSLADGLSHSEILDHYPHPTEDDIHAALAYAGQLANGHEAKDGRRRSSRSVRGMRRANHEQAW